MNTHFLPILRRLSALCVVFIFIASVGIATAQDSGFTEQDLKDINNQVPWYGPSIEGCTTDSSSGGEFSGNNIKDAFLYFLNPPLNPYEKLTAIQSAGIVGNLIQESGVNPRSNQPNGPGMGIAQWSEGGRWEDLKRWVAENNKGDIYSLSVQLDFLWHEMENVPPWNQTLTAIGQIKVGYIITDDDIYNRVRDLLNVGGSGYFTIEDDNQALAAATVVFERKFEKAGDPRMPRRYQNAKNVLKQFGSLAPSSPTTITDGQTRDADDGLCGDGGIIENGEVNAEGYAWPMDDRKKHSYGTAPCKQRSCHHDGTPAFDLAYGGNENTSGKAVFAITSGTIAKQGTYRGVRGCFSIQFKSDKGNGKGSYYYWYGHLQNPRFATGDKVAAGQQIAEVARTSLGPVCHGRSSNRPPAPHLHIDRGCIQGGVPQTGGGKSCRDPAFVPLMNKLWEGLSE